MMNEYAKDFWEFILNEDKSGTDQLEYMGNVYQYHLFDSVNQPELKMIMKSPLFIMLNGWIAALSGETVPPFELLEISKQAVECIMRDLENAQASN